MFEIFVNATVVDTFPNFVEAKKAALEIAKELPSEHNVTVSDIQYGEIFYEIENGKVIWDLPEQVG